MTERDRGPADGGSPASVARLDPADAAEVGELFAASQVEYPGFRHVFPDREVRQRVLRVFMTATARDSAKHAHALVARDDAGVVGAALWMPPGTFPMSAARMVRMAPALMRVAFEGPRSFRGFQRIGIVSASVHPEEPSWYLQAMGVHPRAQRRGVGKRLMAPALALADEANLPCYVQTSDPANTDYYARYGFEVVQPEIKVFADGPAYIGMIRPPGSAR